MMLTTAASIARAEPPRGCSGPELVLDPRLSHRRTWSNAASDARRRVAELADVDACARLEVEQAPGTVRVRAESADGRAVVRELSGPGELEATVVALLVLPPTTEADSTRTGRAANTAASPPAPPASKPESTALGDSNPRADTAPTSKRSEPTLASTGRSLEVALGAGIRTAPGLLGPGVAAVVNATLHGWLVGGLLSAEQTQAAPAVGHFSLERSASLGFVFGRRLLRRPFLLDVALQAPLLRVSSSKWLAETQHTGEVEGAEAGDDDFGFDGSASSATETTTSTETRVVPLHADLRAGAFVRAVAPLTGPLGMFVEVDGEHTLGVLTPPSATGQPRLGQWTAGASIGLFWSNL
jgi:hypothetical protein